MKLRRIGREGDAKQLSVVLHSLPVPLEGKQDAVVDANGAENAPAGEQPELSGRQYQLRRVAELVIVQQIPVDHSFSLRL